MNLAKRNILRLCPVAPYCGQTIIISNTDPVNGQLYMTSAPIIDLCATCDEGSDQLDLS